MHPFLLLSLDAEADADLNRAAVIEREKASGDDDEEDDRDRRHRECHVAAALFSEPKLKLCIDRGVRRMKVFSNRRPRPWSFKTLPSRQSKRLCG